MLKIPHVLMINCIGSYFYSIVDCMSPQGAEHILLYYLSSYKLTFKHLIMKEVKKKYSNNPWGYQPITATNMLGESLAIDDSFYLYLFETHGIIVERIDMNHNKNVINYLVNHKGYGKFNIYSVDEFFIPQSENFYNQRHNKHFLLINNVDLNNRMIDIIDSEKNKTYLLSFNDLTNAVYNSRFRSKLYYKIDCTAFKNAIDREKVLQNYLVLKQSYAYLPLLIDDMKEKLNISCNEQDYFFKGYYYNILSKILPFAMMRYHLFIDNNIYINEIIVDTIKEWKSLCNFMKYKIYKMEYDYKPIEKKLYGILAKEKKISLYMQTIGK